MGDNQEPCCSWIGQGGSGHFVKMVHNGIEYADMELIAESYALMKKVLGMSPTDIQTVFQKWNEGPLKSYLIEITAKVLGKKDSEAAGGSGFLVDVISDQAGQKGTGKWTAQMGVELGVPIPTIAEALNIRNFSGLRAERVEASSILQTPPVAFAGDSAEFIKKIEDALYASKIVAYAQGFALMQEAAKQYSWKLNIAAIVASWRGGCIIRAELLSKIMETYQSTEPAANLLIEPVFKDELLKRYENWKGAIIQGITSGVSLSGFTSSLGYFEAYRDSALPTNLIQAQRDFFGAHTYERTDKSGSFHTEWEHD